MDKRNLAIGIMVGLLIVGVSFSATGYAKHYLRGFQIFPAHESSVAVTAPDLSPGDWINSEPLQLNDLRGRVVLIDFWTFGCYNCRNTLPFINSWHERYGAQGLTVIGVHSPEFEYEKKIANLREQVASLGIRYPVVSDNDYKTWNAYDVAAWPTVFLIDKQGRIRWVHVGEGRYDEAEQLIRKLLAEK